MTTRYVSRETGDDTNDGLSEANAKKTLAATTKNDGDVIILLQGTYKTSDGGFAAGSFGSGKITYQGKRRHTAFIIDDTPGPMMQIDASNDDYVRFENLVFNELDDACIEVINSGNDTGVEFANCKFVECEEIHEDSSGGNIHGLVMDHCIMDRCGGGDSLFTKLKGHAALKTKIENCVFYNCNVGTEDFLPFLGDETNIAASRNNITQNPTCDHVLSSDQVDGNNDFWELLDYNTWYQCAGTTGFANTGTGLKDGIAAQGTLSLPINPSNGDTFTIDSKVYTMQDTLTDVDGNIKIGASASETQGNIKAAINLEAGAGTKYAASMTLHPTVSCGSWSSDDAVMTAKTKGSAGNSIATTDTFTAEQNQFDAATLGTTTLGRDGFEQLADDTAAGDDDLGTDPEMQNPAHGKFGVVPRGNSDRTGQARAVRGAIGVSIVLDNEKFATSWQNPTITNYSGGSATLTGGTWEYTGDQGGRSELEFDPIDMGETFTIDEFLQHIFEDSPFAVVDTTLGDYERTLEFGIGADESACIADAFEELNIGDDSIVQQTGRWVKFKMTLRNDGSEP